MRSVASTSFSHFSTLHLTSAFFRYDEPDLYHKSSAVKFSNALNYLDQVCDPSAPLFMLYLRFFIVLQVKSTFSHRPEVYNAFLDVMKDFKNRKYVVALIGRDC